MCVRVCVAKTLPCRTVQIAAGLKATTLVVSNDAGRGEKILLTLFLRSGIARSVLTPGGVAGRE